MVHVSSLFEFFFFFFSHLPGFCQLAASNNKLGSSPFPFAHDYSLKHQAGPGLPSVVLDCTKYPTEGEDGAPSIIIKPACFNTVKLDSGTATSYFVTSAQLQRYQRPCSRMSR